MTPAALVALLDEIFSAFDELAHEHGLEKIKTLEVKGKGAMRTWWLTGRA